MSGMTILAVAAISFVGSHFVLSHPLRRPLVRTLGERAFLGLYSAVAIVTLGLTVWAFRIAPTTTPLWRVGDGLWATATLLMLAASGLLVGSLIGNPALPNPGGTTRIPAATRGVFLITRHPMMWSFALWGVSHILIYPVTKNLILATAIIVLALVGAALQDHKKSELDPAGWSLWKAHTSYWPFGAIIAGRVRFGRFATQVLTGAFISIGGLALWWLATWAHLPLAGMPAGIWRWVSLRQVPG